MKVDQDLSTRVCERDKLECGCDVNAQARIDTPRVDANNMIEKRGTNRNMGASSCPNNGDS